MDNREIICIHVGQAGIQIGSAVWELFTVEHELDECGKQICYCPWPLMDNTNALFIESGNGQFKPRSLMVDSESLVIDEIKSGIWNKMFDPRSLISGKEDAASIFTKGFNLCANEVLDESLTHLRVLMEDTSFLNGFLIFHSLGGGTGSGLTCRLAETIQYEAPRKPMIHLTVVPPTNKTGFILEPYNGILSTAALLESSSLMCMMENEALYKAVEGLSNRKKISFIDINRRISQIASSLTTSYRFSNKLSSDFCVFQTNLVPFPEIHFPVTSYVQSNDFPDINLIHITKLGFNKNHITLKLNMEKGYYMSCCLLYRGVNCRPMNINNAIRSIKSDSSIKFVDWSPTGFKVAINVQMPGFIPLTNIAESRQSLCVLANSTAIVETWAKLLEQFQNLFSRRAFLHRFLADGVDEAIFKEAEERIIDIISKYKDLETDKNVSHLANQNPTTESRNFLQKINPPPCNDEDLVINVKTKMNFYPGKSAILGAISSNKTVEVDVNNKSRVSFNESSPSKFEKKDGKRSPEKNNSRENSSDNQSDILSKTSMTMNQYNLSSKYKELLMKINYCRDLQSNQLRDLPSLKDSIYDSLSQTCSIFSSESIVACKSSETLNNLQTSSFSVPSKQNPTSFSSILRQSIVNISHLYESEKESLFNNSMKSKVFLSKFCRLNSQITLSKSQETLCSVTNHSWNLNHPINCISYISVFNDQLKENPHLSNEIVHFQRTKSFSFPEKEKRQPILFPENQQLKVGIMRTVVNKPETVFQSFSFPQRKNLMLNSRVARNLPKHTTEMASQTKIEKKSFGYKLSRLFSRRTIYTESKKHIKKDYNSKKRSIFCKGLNSPKHMATETSTTGLVSDNWLDSTTN